jgi:hypothetical protein
MAHLRRLRRTGTPGPGRNPLCGLQVAGTGRPPSGSPARGLTRVINLRISERTSPIMPRKDIDPDARDYGPSGADIAAIDAEWPLIEAELALLDAEIHILTVAHRVSELDWRRLRRAEDRVTREAAALATRAATKPTRRRAA